MRPAPVLAALILAVALAPALAEAGHMPLYFWKEYGWFGIYTPGFLSDTQTFGVSASANLLCYERLTGIGQYDANTFRATLRDGAGRLVILDAGGLVEDPDEGVRVLTPLAPLSPTSYQYSPGTFTLTFEAEGYSGDFFNDYAIRVYGVATRAQCGHYSSA